MGWNGSKPEKTMPALRMVVRGLVQGVGFRWWAARHASRLGLSGHVRNLPDGSVELVVSGERESLDEMMELCLKGPSASEVSGVSAFPCPEPGVEGFTILRDGRG
ncbi:acylphosphatase [Candidatus Fermentibacteria bacterium]|nr:acylphosphatase [Candidatus Fermentibacteria bacterium]